MPPPNQRPAPNQPFPLPIERQKSTIPKAGTEDTWVYPSQQMFFNALLRKGWEFGPEDIKAEDMEHIIKIPGSILLSKCFLMLFSGKVGSSVPRISRLRIWNILLRYIMLIMSQRGKRFYN